MAIKTISLPDNLLQIANERGISLSKATQIGIKEIIERSQTPEGETKDTLKATITTQQGEIEHLKRTVAAKNDRIKRQENEIDEFKEKFK